MNWIEVLYPKPSFFISPALGRFRHIHRIALSVAYYLSQTLALAALTVLYFTLILGSKVWLVFKGQDPLKRKFLEGSQSYLQKSKSVKEINFQRMY